MFNLKIYKSLCITAVAGLFTLNADIFGEDWDYDSFRAETMPYPFQFEGLSEIMREIEASMNEVDATNLKYLASLIMTSSILHSGSVAKPVPIKLEHARAIVGLACFGIPPYTISTLDLATIEEIYKDLRDDFLTVLLQNTIEEAQTDTSNFMLNFVDEPIASPVFNLLVKLLKRNGALKKLSLNGSNLNDTDIQMLTNVLECNTSLLELKFFYANTELGGKVAEHFAEVLKKNSTLTTLCLLDCNIGNVGTEALAGALKDNKTLITLDLWRNNVGDAGAQDLIEALKTNDSLYMLKIEGNKVSVSVLEALQKMAKSKPHLTIIY